MGVALQSVFKGVIYLAFTSVPPWYNYQPLCGVAVIPWQNPLIHPRTMIQAIPDCGYVCICMHTNAHSYLVMIAINSQIFKGKIDVKGEHLGSSGGKEATAPSFYCHSIEIHFSL